MQPKVSKATMIRTIVLLIALLNSIFVQFGLESLPLTEEQVETAGVLIYELASHVFLIATSLLAWWKNNSFTKSAIYADSFLKREKLRNK